MRSCIQAVACLFIAAIAFGGVHGFGLPHRKQKSQQTAKVVVESGKPACSVDVDGVASGKTNSLGRLVLSDVSPSDHYVHVQCPGQPVSTTFISPVAGSTTNVQPRLSLTGEGGGEGFELAENNLELRKLIS
ncbi:MAG: hypothetical protein KGM47_13450, partial [Acidobacteriota bacterium]|nr:hypothetical protein [Acidobacteriota bacterium]